MLGAICQHFSKFSVVAISRHQNTSIAESFGTWLLRYGRRRKTPICAENHKFCYHLSG